MSTKHITIIGAPIDLGSEQLGVEMGPDAIRAAGIIHTLKNLGFTIEDHGNIPVPNNGARVAGNPKVKYLEAVVQFSRVLAEVTTNAVKNNHIPLTIGGDHSAAIGTIAGVTNTKDDVGLIWIDAHPDANTPETTLTGNIHGMPLAISLGYGPKECLTLLQNQKPLDPRKVAVLGIKNPDQKELDLLKNLGVRVFTMREVIERGIAAVMNDALAIVHAPGRHLHVSVDLDVIDRADAPGVGIASRGGFNYREITYVTERIGETGTVGSLDLIELNPTRDLHNETAQLAVELAVSFLGARFTDYERYLEAQQP